MSAPENLKVLIVSSEVSPFAKSGGLGDVMGSLPKELRKYGVDCRIVMPKYKNINSELLTNLEYVDSFEVSLGWRRQSASIFALDGQVPIYFVENDYYFGRDGFYGYGDDFERFGFFSKAALEILGVIDFAPDIIHLNDWQTSLCALYLRDVYHKFLFFKNIKTVFTIHNLQYQGVFGRGILSNVDLNDGYFSGGLLEFYGNVSFMKAGIIYADMITTVSETYAREIQSPEYAFGLDGLLRARSNDLFGVLNGIDCEKNDPGTDPCLFKNFDINSIELKKENKTALQRMLNLPIRPDVPVFSIISRLVDQKGLDLIANCMEELMSKDIQLIVLGAGDGRYEHLFHYMSNRYPGKVSANICFNFDLAQKIYASSDMFLMPSLFEPCGLGQLFAMRYGTIPIVRDTGGLSDTVQHFDKETKQGNGFLFKHYLSSGLMWAVNEALSVYYDKENFDCCIRNAMNSDYSWSKSAEKYIELYLKLKNRE